MTDWNLIREMMASAIDACERVEAAGYTENDRDGVVSVHGQDVSIHDFLVSAWTYPERIRYTIIRQRQAKGDDFPYVPETARVLVAMAQAAGELVGSGDAEAPAVNEIRQMNLWFGKHAAPGIEQAIVNRRGGSV